MTFAKATRALITTKPHDQRRATVNLDTVYVSLHNPVDSTTSVRDTHNRLIHPDQLAYIKHRSFSISANCALSPTLHSLPSPPLQGLFTIMAVPKVVVALAFLALLACAAAYDIQE